MSMSEYECMHDCTCCATSDLIEEFPAPENDLMAGPGTVVIHRVCDLPGGHARSVEGEHWDPLWGWWDAP